MATLSHLLVWIGLALFFIGAIVFLVVWLPARWAHYFTQWRPSLWRSGKRTLLPTFGRVETRIILACSAAIALGTLLIFVGSAIR
ncbi:MAG: hypothetical protein M0R80_04860 [Proteobacteria bacterium]|nr:hypothetical protein [Pseudomonadota bacterium]